MAPQHSPTPEERSPAGSLSSRGKQEIQRFVSKLSETERQHLLYYWPFWARPKQLAPSGSWKFWVLFCGRGWGKLLALDTPIPTPTGWVRNDELEIGSEVFDEEGRPCRVVDVFDGFAHEAWRLHFSDGCTIDACGDHQWVTHTHQERKSLLRSADLSPHLLDGSIRTTREIVETLYIGKRRDRNHSVRVAGPLQLPSRDLPLDPYLLGVWLGDGHSRSGSITTADASIVESFRADGWTATRKNELEWSLRGDPQGPRRRYARGLGYLLSEIGVLGSKHVPGVYLRASEEHRLSLLQGLMDSDGYAEGSKVEFCSTRWTLAQAVVELARSLGQKPIVDEGRARLYGRDCGPRYRVGWRPTRNVFRLDRKRRRVRTLEHQANRARHRMIVSAEKIEPQPMRCLSVDAPSRMYLAGSGMIPTHNTATAAQWIRDRVESGIAKRIAFVARTPADARDVMIEGESGILSLNVSPPWFRPRFEPTKRRLTWPRPRARGVGRIVVGSEATTATIYSAQEPKNLRGPQHDTAWCEEIAHWESREAFDQLSIGLRIGQNPQCVVTSTPVPRPLIYELRDSKRSVVTYGSTYENLENLADSYEEIIERFRGTRVERQELYGEILQALEGALVTYEHLSDSRMLDEMPPPFHRCVIGVDPAASSHEKSDETGIVTAGSDKGGHGYIQDDWSCRGPPDEWAKRAIQLFHERGADAIVAEKNNGGEMVQDVIRTRAPEIPVRLVWASRGKSVRFSPIAALYAQRRVHHVGVFPELESQLTAWDVDGYQGEGSPDRSEAATWALTHLLITRKRKTAGVFGGARLHRGDRESA